MYYTINYVAHNASVHIMTFVYKIMYIGSVLSWGIFLYAV